MTADTAGRFADRRRAAARRSALPGLCVAGVVTVVALVAWLLLDTSLFAVRDVEVTGTGRLAPVAVLAAADVPVGSPLARLDADAVAARVREALPAVAAVSVDRDWPRTVRLRVTERQPAVALRTTQGTGLMDAGGVVFARVGRVPVGVPVLETPRPGRDDAATRSGLAVLGGLPPDLRQKVFVVRAGSPDDVELELRGGAEVVWGAPEQAARKAEVLRVLLRRPAEVYDVSSPDVVTTRGEPTPAPS